MSRAKRALLAWVPCLLVLSCKDEPKTAPAAAASVAPVPSATAPAAAASTHASVTPLPPPRQTGCTFLAVTGDVKAGPENLVPKVTEPANDVMVTLGAGAKLTVRDRVSGRESNLVGPGSARVCVGGDTEHWLFGGTFTSSAFTGATPGSGEWVVVPGAIVRINASTVHVKVTAEMTEISVVSGSAAIFPVGAALGDAGAPDAQGWWHVASGATRTFAEPPPHKIELVTRCDRQASLARDLGAQIAMADAGLGDLAPKHIAAREQARAICAEARYHALGDKGLSLRADAADARWRVVVAPP